MTDIIRTAAQRTSNIIGEADMAVLLLSGNDGPRVNALGVLHDPSSYRLMLQQARAAIDRAITEHEATNWPSEADYHAL